MIRKARAIWRGTGRDGNGDLSTTTQNAIAVVSIDIGKNSFHIVALDDRGAIVLRQKWSRNQIDARFANIPPCLIGMEACVGAHHLSRKLKAFGHDARLMPANQPYPNCSDCGSDNRGVPYIPRLLTMLDIKGSAFCMPSRCCRASSRLFRQ
jgi:hypothetical protein